MRDFKPGFDIGEQRLLEGETLPTHVCTAT